MIRYTTGDLLAADVEAVINTVNTVGVMGKGIALQFKRRYPENFELYKKACARGEVNLGEMFVTKTHEIVGPEWIVNFPTKGHWKANSRIEDIDRGLNDLVRVIKALDIHSIAIPPLGAGNGGLRWQDVRPRIVSALKSLDDVEIIIYEPAAGHHAIAGQKLKMTRLHALMLKLIDAYALRKAEVWPGSTGASAIEIQKLMYFAQRKSGSFDLKFARGHYGPYSEPVRHILTAMEGSFLRGYGDGSDRALDLAPIHVTAEGHEALGHFIDPGDNAQELDELVVQVMELTDGLEGLYQLELLSSVMWIADEIGTTEVAPIVKAIGAWNVRKERLFTPNHVAVAARRLAS